MVSLKVIPFLLLSSVAFGAITNLVVLDSTAQQGGVQFNAPDPLQCTFAVYRDPAMTDQIDDTNNTVFSGSQNCTRVGNIVDGRQVTLVIGQRTAEASLDAAIPIRSRSLRVATTYYVRITDGTDSSTVSTTFTTRNIPWGQTHIEEVLFNASGFNHWSYPSLDWSDAGLTKSYIDPLTGLSFSRVVRNMFGRSGSGSSTTEEITFNTAFGSAWSNPANAVNNSTSGPFAIYANTGQDPLFLPFRYDAPNFGQPILSPWPIAASTAEDIQAKIYGVCTSTGNPEDCKVLVCLVGNYAVGTAGACPGGRQVEASIPTSVGSVRVPGSYPTYAFLSWGGTPLTGHEISAPSGNATVSGTDVVLTSGYLPPTAVVGEKIRINGTWCTIAALGTARSFTIDSCGASSGAWGLGAFGLRIRKKTTVNNSISVGASYSIVYSENKSTPANPHADICHPSDFPVLYAADGTTLLTTPKRGRLCNLRYGIIMLADDGETRFLTPIQKADPSGGGSNISVPLQPWKPSDPYTFMALFADDTGTARDQAFYEVTYDTASTSCRFKSWAGNAWSGTNGPADCFVWNNKNSHLTGQTVTAQITANLAAYVPSWNSTLTDPGFGDIPTAALIGVGANYLTVFLPQYQYQNNPCIVAVFSASTYQLTQIFSTFDGSLPGMRWAGCHQNGAEEYAGTPSYAQMSSSLLSGNASGGALRGPFIVSATTAITAKSLDGGSTWNSNTSLGSACIEGEFGCSTNPSDCDPGNSGISYTVLSSHRPPGHAGISGCVSMVNATYKCGSNVYGVTGPQCVKLKVANDRPCNMNATATEAALWPCPWHAGWSQPLGMTLDTGDYISRASNDDNSNMVALDGKREKMRILSKASDGAGGWIYELQRWATCDNPTSDRMGYPAAVQYFDHLFDGQAGNQAPNGWNLYVTGSGACSGTTVWIDLSSAQGSTAWKSDDNSVNVEHSTWGIGENGTDFVNLGLGFANTGTMLTMAGQPPNNSWSDKSQSFNNLSQSWGEEVESYPSMGNWNAPTRAQRRLGYNFFHINPAQGSDAEDIITPFSVTFTLVGSNKYTYLVSQHQPLGDFKSRPANVFSTAGAFQSLSSPTTGNIISDATPWKYCIAYKTNECVTGSAAGDVYVSAPNAWKESGGCVSDSFKTYTPCATPLWSNGAWIVQRDVHFDDLQGWRFRRLTMGLSGPTMQYQYSSPYMIANGSMALTRAAWAGGVGPWHLAYRMPPPPTDDGVDRQNFINVPVKLPAGMAYGRVRFGYVENGLATQYYCTARAEACVTDSSLAPFAFISSDTLTPTSCSSGCTINVPALSGRMLYYVWERSQNGSTWISGPRQVKAIL